jgi:hypothetical protein
MSSSCAMQGTIASALESGHGSMDAKARQSWMRHRGMRQVTKGSTICGMMRCTRQGGLLPRTPGIWPAGQGDYS